MTTTSIHDSTVTIRSTLYQATLALNRWLYFQILYVWPRLGHGALATGRLGAAAIAWICYSVSGCSVGPTEWTKGENSQADSTDADNGNSALSEPLRDFSLTAASLVLIGVEPTGRLCAVDAKTGHQIWRKNGNFTDVSRNRRALRSIVAVNHPQDEDPTTEVFSIRTTGAKLENVLPAHGESSVILTTSPHIVEIGYDVGPTMVVLSPHSSNGSAIGEVTSYFTRDQSDQAISELWTIDSSNLPIKVQHAWVKPDAIDSESWDFPVHNKEMCAVFLQGVNEPMLATTEQGHMYIRSLENPENQVADLGPMQGCVFDALETPSGQRIFLVGPEAKIVVFDSKWQRVGGLGANIQLEPPLYRPNRHLLSWGDNVWFYSGRKAMLFDMAKPAKLGPSKSTVTAHSLSLGCEMSRATLVEIMH